MRSFQSKAKRETGVAGQVLSSGAVDLQQGDNFEWPKTRRNEDKIADGLTALRGLYISRPE